MSDSIIRQGLAEEIVGAYRALANLHRAVVQHSRNPDEAAANADQADILEREARLWHLRLRTPTPEAA